MEMGMLVYKRQKGTITAEDYIAWSHTMLVQGNESPSIQMMSAFTPGANLFEIEAFFQRALHEMGLVVPTIEPNSRATIAILANEILRVNDDEQLAQLANDIFHIVSELNYPEDLIGWYEISEMQDRLTYDTLPLPFGIEEIMQKIKEEARRVLATMK